MASPARHHDPFPPPTWVVTVSLWLAVTGCGGPEPAPATDGGPPDAGRVVSGGPLRVATWNLENFPLHPDTIGSVAAIVEAQDLDLIAVQEIVDDEAFAALGAALPDYESVVGADDVAFRRVGMLFRRSRVEVTNADLLFGGDRYAFPRSPLSASVTVRGSGGGVAFDFTLVVVHLKAQIDEESESRRRAAIVALDAWIQARVAAGGDPDVVVAGDFNDGATDPPTRNVFGPLLEPERYRVLTEPAEAAGERTFLIFDAFLDHVVITADAVAEYGAGSTEVLPLESSVLDYTFRVSDHRPVVVTFELP